MSKSGPKIESQPSTGGYPDGDAEYAEHEPRWLVGLVIAASVLAIMAVSAYLLLGRELLQRSFLMVTVVCAWLGALVGTAVGSELG